MALPLGQRMQSPGTKCLQNVLCIPFNLPCLAMKELRVEFAYKISNLLIQQRRVHRFSIQESCELHQRVCSISSKPQNQKFLGGDVCQPCSGPCRIGPQRCHAMQGPEETFDVQHNSSCRFREGSETMLRCWKARSLRAFAMKFDVVCKPSRKNVWVENFLHWRISITNCIRKGFLALLMNTFCGLKKHSTKTQKLKIIR